MTRLRGFGRRFRFPWRSAEQIRRDVDDEFAFHLAEKTDALQREGFSADEAREEALRQFGDLEAAREQLVAADRSREKRSRRLMSIDELIRDIRHAWRSLWRTPGFTIVAVLVLGTGIGIVTGAFSLINVVALKPALIDEPDRVRGVFALQTEGRGSRRFSYPEYVDIRERVESFSGLAAYTMLDAGVEEGAITRTVQTAFASANYFETLGVPLAQGRGFTLAEERGEAPPTAVVSHDYWVRNGADPELPGAVVRVNGEPFVVVGIARRGFTGTMAIFGVDIWLPLAAAERTALAASDDTPNLRDPRSRSLLLFGRLEDGITAPEADSELAGLATRVIDASVSDPNACSTRTRLEKWDVSPTARPQIPTKACPAMPSCCSP